MHAGTHNHVMGEGCLGIATTMVENGPPDARYGVGESGTTLVSEKARLHIVEVLEYCKLEEICTRNFSRVKK